MSEVFGVSDLMRSMVELERIGHAFYQKAAQQTGDAEARKLFRFLADEEAKHEATYSQLAVELENTAPRQEEMGGSYLSYLHALLSQNFDFTPADLASPEAALKFAVSLEKDTLIYIGEMQSLMKTWKSDLFDRIRREEQNHLRLRAEHSK